MNKDEASVYKYLKAHYGENIVFEPDGKVPPDFLIGSTIAVEVRRLNKSFFGKDKSEGLEQVTFPIFDVVSEVLKSFDSLYQGNTYWVSIQYERPLNTNMCQVKKEMEVALQTFISLGITEFPYKLLLDPKIEFTIYSSQPIAGRVFRPADGIDRNANGWVIPSYKENLRHCIIEKSGKIANYIHKYREWCLYLVDHMGWGLDERETENLALSIEDIGNFKKVFVISNNGEILLASIQNNRVKVS